MQKVSYMGNGETTEFNFNFPYFENTNIIVTKNGTTATGYSIVGTSGGLDADIPYTGGKVVFETAPTSLDSITIARSLPLSRVVDYQPLAQIDPTTVDKDMNYMMEVLKDLQDEFDDLRTQYSEIADKDSTATLLARIQTISTAISTVSAQITALGDISTLRQNVTDLSTTVGGHTTSISALELAVQNPIFPTPDYEHGVTLAANQTHTATADGWVFFYEFSNGDQYVTIDGVQLRFGAGNGAQQYTGNSIMLPIAKGHTFSGTLTVTFFPCLSA